MRENTTEDRIGKAYQDFDTFFTATRAYREKCAMNEKYWSGSHWEGAGGIGQGAGDASAPTPVTPVLFATLESVLADLMDHYPEAILLGEEPGDDRLAEELSQMVQFILKRRGFRETYRRKCRGALIKGASVLQIYWDDQLLGGLGDVNVRDVDIRSFLWDPAFENIQDGRACIQYGFMPREWFAKHYPKELENMVGDGYRPEQYGAAFEQSYEQDDAMLMDYWFKEIDQQGVERVHMLRLAGKCLLEDSRKLRPQGMYAHGMYPFLVEALYPLQGKPVGLGMIDMLKNMQQYADRMDQMIMENLLMSSKPKMMINRGADIDEEALTDWSREVVRAGRIDDGAVRWLQAAPLNPYVLTHHRAKLEAIKEQSGQNQFNRGEAIGGVTAASAIIALQEAGNKRSRMLIEQMNDGFERMVRMVIELIAENYQETRRVRVRGSKGDQGILAYENQSLIDRGSLDFDISIQVQKQTPYKTLYQNDLAIQLMKNGLITQADALEMMNFEGKERVLAKANNLQQEQTKATYDPSSLV